MQNSANKKTPYMSPHQRRTIAELTRNLIQLITDCTCSNEIKGKAITIIDYYLVNPFTKRQDDFFKVSMIYDATHDHSADPRYVPFLSMLLLSNYDLLERRIEMLNMVGGLGFRPETILTAEHLQNRFVEGLALYTEIDHSDLDQLMSFLPMHAFGCVQQPTGLKDLVS